MVEFLFSFFFSLSVVVVVFFYRPAVICVYTLEGVLPAHLDDATQDVRIPSRPLLSTPLLSLHGWMLYLMMECDLITTPEKLKRRAANQRPTASLCSIARIRHVAYNPSPSFPHLIFLAASVQQLRDYSVLILTALAMECDGTTLDGADPGHTCTYILFYTRIEKKEERKERLDRFRRDVALFSKKVNMSERFSQVFYQPVTRQKKGREESIHANISSVSIVYFVQHYRLEFLRFAEI